jgi:hypothetical protein
MAVTDSYCTAAEYRAGIDQDDTAEDAEILLYLTAVSRLIENRIGPMISGVPRHFTKDAAVTARYFEHPGSTETVMIDGIVPVGRGSRRLWVDDIGDLTNMTVKVDLNADYDVADAGETLTINTDFVVGPWNAAKGGEAWPYTFLELMTTSTAINAWPTAPKSIEITAIFGWPAVPEAIKRATIALAKQLRDVSKEPYTLTLENLEQRLPLTGGGARILDDIVHKYGRKVFAL